MKRSRLGATGIFVGLLALQASVAFAETSPNSRLDPVRSSATQVAQWERTSLDTSRSRAPDVMIVGYSFAGEIIAPERFDGDALLVRIQGDLTLPPKEIYGPRILYRTPPGDASQGQGIWVSVGGYRADLELPGLAGTYFITGETWATPCEPFTLNVGPGGGSGVWQPLSGELIDPFVIHCVVSRQTVTHASSSLVVEGETVAIEAIESRVWSDGLRSEDPPKGYCVLQFRAIGTALWSEASRGSCDVTQVPTVPGDYRFLVDGSPVDSTFVDVQPAPLKDTAAPNLGYLAGSSDVEPGSSVMLNWHLTDESGVASTSAVIRNSDGQLVSTCDGGTAQRVSGTATDGWYEQTCLIPEGLAEGNYFASVRAEDLVGNEATAGSFAVRVVSARDVDAPRVESLTGPAQADPGSTVTFQWRLADESGVSSASVVLRNAAGQLTRVCDGGSGRLISGNASDGWYEQVCSLPQSMSAGDYTASVRAADVAGNSATSGSFTLRVNSAVGSGDEIVVTGPFWLGKTYADSKAVKAGTRVRISADVEAMWSDGQRHPAPGVKAYVQVMPSWSDEWHGFEHTVSFDMGILEAWTEVEETGRYRFMLEDGTASTPVEISVISAAPDQVSVKWPSRVVGKFKAKVVLKEAGKVWRKREKVVLEVKASGSDSWRVVARASTKRGKATLTTRQLALGTWRVRVPAHDLEDARVYGTA